MPEWLNTTLSCIALAISILAWRQGVWLRQRDLALQVHERVLKLAGRLSAAVKSGDEMKASWKAILAKQGMLNSGLTLQISDEIDQQIETAKHFQQKVGAVKRTFRWRELSKADESMLELHRLEMALEPVFLGLHHLEARLRDKQSMK